MNYKSIKYFCTANGKGVRTALFVSGCRLHCEGCFNKESWNFKAGKELTEDKINEILNSIEPEYIQGLSILGGEPLDDNNVEGVLHVIEMFRERFGNKKDIWMWSGYYVEDSMKHPLKEKAIKMCDYVVDGPYEQDKWNINLVYKGSSNQNIYHIVNGELEKVTFDRVK